MLIACLDESGHETNDIVIVAGFLGNETQWSRCAKLWLRGLGPQRKILHMRQLRWKKDSTRRLLERLGPIPHGCGLTALLAEINVAHYHDLVAGTEAEKLTKGYHLGILTIMDSIVKNIPKHETVKLVLDRQKEYEKSVHQLFEANTHHRAASGEPKIASIEFVSKDDSVFIQSADYLAFAILQDRRSPASKKAKWCLPILKITQPAFGMTPHRNGLRAVVQTTLKKSPQFAKRRGSSQKERGLSEL
jgi:hypothetical protein